MPDEFNPESLSLQGSGLFHAQLIALQYSRHRIVLVPGFLSCLVVACFDDEFRFQALHEVHESMCL